jgi:tripartite-type tricarboxylate transporter receptor subunit TctC
MRQLGKQLFVITFLIASLMSLPASPFAQETFFRGKVIRIIVGFSPGGGFDTYSRTIARHLSKHIPGNPTIIVSNMPGAGSLILANHLYKAAQADGLTIGNWNGGLIMGQLLGQSGTDFDARRFEWIGAPVTISPVCLFSKSSGITSMEEWAASKRPVPVGTIGPGSNTHDVPKILTDALALPTQLVPGYKGFSEIRLAIESGEVAGGCPTWEATRGTWNAVDTGEVVAVVQAVPKPAPGLADVPLAIKLAKTEEDRQLIQAGIHNVNALNRPYSLPPGTPKERVKILRNAFQATLKDPAFLADAKKSKLGVDPITGEELEEMVAALFKLSPQVVAKLKAALQ